MTLSSSESTEQYQENSDRSTPENNSQGEKILCPHCRRTATNGIKCKGICVADNDY